MSGSYSQFTLHDSFPCSPALADKIMEALVAVESEDAHGIDAEYNDGQFYMFGEENAQSCNLPDAVIELIGKALTEAGIPFIGFGECWYSDKLRPATTGGQFGRFYADGFMEIAEEKYSHEPTSGWKS
jgi:hypothetical protein